MTNKIINLFDLKVKLDQILFHRKIFMKSQLNCWVYKYLIKYSDCSSMGTGISLNKILPIGYKMLICKIKMEKISGFVCMMALVEECLQTNETQRNNNQTVFSFFAKSRGMRIHCPCTQKDQGTGGALSS